MNKKFRDFIKVVRKAVVVTLVSSIMIATAGCIYVPNDDPVTGENDVEKDYSENTPESETLPPTSENSDSENIEGENTSAYKTIYPVPEKNKTVEDIKAEGREVTADDVINALNYYCYLDTFEAWGDEVDVSAQFKCITQRKGFPFYYIYARKIWVDFNFYKGMGPFASLPGRFGYEFPESFAKVLEGLGAEKFLLTGEYLKNIPHPESYTSLIGEYVYSPIVIDRESISGMSDTEALELFLELLEQAIEDFKIEHNLVLE